ncbi:MAG TPA: TonB-dependent receptor, partial [Rubricoccaceae bacterium]
AVVLRVSYVGYAAQRVELTLAPDETRRLDVALVPAGLDEVVVEAETPLAEERPPGVTDVPLQLVRRLPSVFEADLFRSMQLLPGVKSANDFSSALYIRGGSPDQTLVLLDGTTVYNPTHFFGFFSTFNTDAIRDVRLYKGAYPSTFGGRLGSVLDISTREGNRNRVAGNATLGVLASRVGVEGPIGGRGSFMLAARRSTLEPLLGYLRTTPDSAAVPEGFYFYDVNGRVGVDLTPRDRLSVSAYAGRDRVQVAFGEDSDFTLDYGNRTVSAGYTRVLSGTVFAQARATASRYFSYPVGSVAGTTFRRPNTISDYSGRLDVEWAPTGAAEFRAGAWGGALDLRLQSEFNGTTAIDFRNPAGYGSGYVQTRLRPGAGVILTGGLRAEYFQSLTDDATDADDAANAGYLRLSPQVQVERTFGDGLVLQASAGRYHQFLSLISNEAFSGFDTWVTTGVGVPPQQSEQVVVGAKTRLGTGYRLDVEVYGRTMRDLFDIRPELQDVSGLAYRELFRFGEGYAYGTEILLEKGTGRLTGLIGYTLGVTRRRYPDEPAFSETFAPKYDRLHDLTAVATVDVGRGWSVTAAGTYATGQAYTAPESRYEVGGLPFANTTADALYSPALNNARLPPYHRVDVGARRAGPLLFLRDTELQVQVVNAYSRRNVWFVTYDFDENPVELSRVTQLPRLPNVSFTVRF